MMGNLNRTALALGIAASALAGTASAAEYIVKMKSAGEAEAFAVSEALESAKVEDVHAPGALVKVSLPDAEESLTAQRLKEIMDRPDVEYVVANFQLKALSTPNDPRLSEQWALAKVRATTAWDRTVGSRSISVAVIDTGVDYRHPDLAANIYVNSGEVAGNGVDDDGNGYVDDVNGWDFLDNDKDPNDATSSQNPGHGTHCAGIIGAVGNNGQGLSGIAQQVAIMPLRFIGPNGQGDLMAAIRSIDYAIAKDVDVISASWGAQVAASQAQPLIEAVVRASDAGIIFVAAAANSSNNNDSVDMYPANVEAVNLIAVAASGPNDEKPDWSNFGKAKVHVAAPGLNILSTLPNNTFGNLSGTSMATPLVAGSVALMLAESANEGVALSGSQIKALLQATGTRAAIETACMCRIDVAAALDAQASNALTLLPTALTLAPNATTQVSAFGGAGGYQFASANPAIIEVTAAGAATAKTVGETTVSVTDSAGATVQSLSFRVAEPSSGGGGGTECPLGDPMLCELMCMIDPTLPWCP
jgi:thermitase